MASSACEIAPLLSPSLSAASDASIRFSASTKSDLPSSASSALRSNFLPESLSPSFIALIAASMDCTIGLSEFVDVELVTLVEFKVEFETFESPIALVKFV